MKSWKRIFCLFSCCFMLTSALAEEEVLIHAITPTALFEMQESKREKITIIDVREQWEVNQGHIKGMVWVPLGRLPFLLDKIPKDKGTIILVCSNSNRSKQAYKFLYAEDYHDLLMMDGGMKAWIELGYPIEEEGSGGKGSDDR